MIVDGNRTDTRLNPADSGLVKCVVLPALMCLLSPDLMSAPAADGDAAALESIRLAEFREHVQPFLEQHCVACHNVNEMTSGVRVDHLDGTLQDRHLRLWQHIRRLLEEGSMPPEEEPQPAAAQTQKVVGWIDRTLAIARSRPAAKDGTARRLTVSQFRNTLRDLLGIDDDLTEILPPDSAARDGFTNNAETLELSPLMIETYIDIAEQALDRCLVNEGARPNIQNFRMDLGRKINGEPFPESLILGANSLLLPNDDFMVTQLVPQKSFAFEPFFMRTRYRFIEGYQGNDTVRGWRDYDSIYHAVFACMRGTDGYPKGNAWETVTEGLLLRPAIPSSEIFGQSSTYGPRANFKISLRELPDHGRFRITVRAARYADGLLLDATDRPASEASVSVAGGGEKPGTDESLTVENASAQEQQIEIPDDGIYQVDVWLQNETPADERGRNLRLTLGNRSFSGSLSAPAFLVVRLAAGPLTVRTIYDGSAAVQRLVLTPLDESQDVAQRFVRFERRIPRLGVHLGLRRDCGSTLSRVGSVRNVPSAELSDFVFEGAIRNFPSPDVEKDNVNYLAGVREIGVRSEFTDGRDMPRLLIRSVEFEGPFYETWPPAPHRAIFIDFPDRADPPAYARQIIRSFASRAFRRPVSQQEEDGLVAVWDRSFAEEGDFNRSVRDALLVVLTSPQFLFLIENSETPEPEPLTSYELAAKLSYVLWNTLPDQRLLELASADRLRESLEPEISRMMADARFGQFAHEFVSQWLGLSALDVVEIDRQRFPMLSRDVRTELRREPVEFVQYLIRNNLSLRHLIRSDFIIVNEVVAGYYGIESENESGFDFVPVTHRREHLGGVLSQAAILAGLSDGRESNPVKRGAWFARRIIAMPPDDPPPNVPALPKESVQHLSLRERLEQHRNQPGCAKCHAGIDPWGVPFEQYDAAGRFRQQEQIDARSILPDETEVDGLNALREYLIHDRLPEVAFSFLKHVASYAAGRDLSYNEIEFLRTTAVEWPDRDYLMQDMFRFVLLSPIFLEK